MKQIVIVANSITDCDSMSGGDKNFIELAKIWKKQGHQVFIVTTQIGQEMCLKAELKADFLLLSDIDPKRYGVIITFLYRLLTSFTVLNTKYKIQNTSQIILSSSHYLTDLLPALWLKRNNPKSIWCVFLHLLFPPPLKGYQFAYRPGRQIPDLKETLNWLFQFPSLFLIKHFSQKSFCVNEEIMNNLAKKGFSKSQLCLYQNGVDHDFIDKIKPSGNIKLDGLFIGRFHPQKGLFDLIPIWIEVVKHIPNAKLGIIGSGSESATIQIRLLIKSYKLDNNIVLLGFKEGKEKFEILKSSKVLLFPSYYESFGIVPLEAQSSRIPVIAYDLPPLKSIFKKGLVFVPLGNTEKFADAVVHLLKNKPESTILAREEFDYSKNFSWEISADSIFR